MGTLQEAKDPIRHADSKESDQMPRLSLPWVQFILHVFVGYVMSHLNF